MFPALLDTPLWRRRPLNSAQLPSMSSSFRAWAAASEPEQQLLSMSSSFRAWAAGSEHQQQVPGMSSRFRAWAAGSGHDFHLGLTSTVLFPKLINWFASRLARFSLFLVFLLLPFSLHFRFTHRRRIYTKEKAKVVIAVWGTHFIQFLAQGWYEEKDELHQDDMKERTNLSYSSKRPGAK